MITRLPTRATSIYSASRPVSRSATRCIHHIKSRPEISRTLFPIRHQQARLSSTTPAPPSPPPTEPSKPIDLRSQLSNAPPPPPNPSIQPTPKRSLRPYIYALTFLVLGLTTGQYVRLVLAPPPLPPAGSPEDEIMIKYLHQQASNLPLIQQLFSDPEWESWDAYETFSLEEKKRRITTGPLAGARGVGGYQRIFRNKITNEFITVIFLGGAIAGWPGVTHGGLIATILDESLGRCAISLFSAGTGVTANLEIDYLRPVMTNSFYVIRTKEMEGEGKEKTERKAWVQTQLETTDGVVCTVGKALYVVPRGFKTREIGGKF